MPGSGSRSTSPGGVAGAAMDRSGGMAGGVPPGRAASGRARLPVGLPATLGTGVRLGVVCGVCGMLTGADASRPSCLQNWVAAPRGVGEQGGRPRQQVFLPP